MTDKIVRPKELLIPPKTVLYTSNYEQKFYKYILTKNSKIQMPKFHLSKKWGAKAPPAPPSPRPLIKSHKPLASATRKCPWKNIANSTRCAQWPIIVSSFSNPVGLEFFETVFGTETYVFSIVFGTLTSLL